MRIFNAKPGFDCRIECNHEIKGQHGICSDMWTYAIVNRDARAALELTIMTPFYPQTVDVGSLPDFLRRFVGSNILMHFGYPINKLQVLKHEPPVTDCVYIGTCYKGGSWSMMADELVKANFDQAQGLKRNPRTLGEQPALWTALESKLVELTEEMQAARLQDGDLRWQVCEHCTGQGVIERRSQ